MCFNFRPCFHCLAGCRIELHLVVKAAKIWPWTTRYGHQSLFSDKLLGSSIGLADASQSQRRRWLWRCGKPLLDQALSLRFLSLQSLSLPNPDIVPTGLCFSTEPATAQPSHESLQRVCQD